MANAQISTSLTIVNSLLGYQGISLTNFATSAESVIASGSKVEVASAYYSFSSDETPQASTWTAISTTSTAYITLTPSGSAGSQILTAMYSATAPVWSDSKQGWYATAASSVRYVGGVHKQGATRYESAFVLDNRQTDSLSWVVIDIGDWDMDATNGVSVSHNLGAGRTIRTVSVVIRNDSETTYYPFPYSDGSGLQGFVNYDSQNVDISRIVSGLFDDTAFNATSFNRGWVTISYEGAEI